MIGGGLKAMAMASGRDMPDADELGDQLLRAEVAILPVVHWPEDRRHVGLNTVPDQSPDRPPSARRPG